jgi:putative hydrolase of the HAD superfamily
LKIFFDVDGVIIDGWHSKPERRKPWDATIEQDLGVNREAFQRAFFTPPRRGVDSLMSACVRGEGDLKEILAELLPTLGYRGSVDAFVEYWFVKDSNINQDVLEIVRRLRKCEEVELYLATGQEHYRAAYLWNDLGLKEIFSDIFYSARLGVPKHQAGFFDKINAHLDISPSERPLFFDDSERVVTAARAAGWAAHIFDTVEDLSRNSRLMSILGG